MVNILEVHNLVKKYGNFTALNDVSLRVPKGCIYGLLGPNGAGKTSLIRIINQITLPDSGKILLDGQQLKPQDVAHIGYMPEERGLYKSMKVGEQALYLAQLKGLTKKEAQKQLQYWFEKLNIEGWWNKKIEELSKGMAQKVQFVVTVLHQPKLLIFDEPFSGFDPVNANIIKDEILALKQNGATIIFSTHRMESVEELCDEIALIHQSNKLLEGNLIDIKKDFRTNQFNVGIETNRKEKVFDLLKNNFKIKPTHFKSLQDELQFTIELSGQNQNELFSLLIPFGNISHFSEIIPSVNDIFIQQVTQ